jgi:hypothetical protein
VSVRLDNNGRLETLPILLSSSVEREGYKPADFDRLIEIAGDGREFDTIDESTLFETQPDFVQWLPRE